MRASVAGQTHASICAGFSIKTRRDIQTLNENGRREAANTCVSPASELRQNYNWAYTSSYRCMRVVRTHLLRMTLITTRVLHISGAQGFR